MSTQRGNVHRHRPQKHKNQTAFKNTLHCNEKLKLINSLRAEGCCARCKDIIDWKIQYKKYKPLSQPKKCIKCNQKTVKRAYFIVCQACAETHKVCVKCGKQEEIVVQIGLTEEELVKSQAQLEQELKYLPERKRRAFLRLQASGKLTGQTNSEGAAICRSKSHEDVEAEGSLQSEDEENESISSEDAEQQNEIVAKSEQTVAQCSRNDDSHSDSEAKNCSDESTECEITKLQDNVRKVVTV